MKKACGVVDGFNNFMSSLLKPEVNDVFREGKVKEGKWFNKCSFDFVQVVFLCNFFFP